MTIAYMTEEEVELYQRSLPPGKSILVVIYPLPVYDLSPEDEEVSGEVHQLRLNRSDGPYVMNTEHIWA